MNSFYSQGLSPRVNAKAPSGVFLSSLRPKSFTFTFLESSIQTVRLIASGVLRAAISSLPPHFQNGLKQTVAAILTAIIATLCLSPPIRGTADSDIARGISAWGRWDLAHYLFSGLPKHGASGESQALGDLGFEPSTLRKVTTSSASCHR